MELVILIASNFTDFNFYNCLVACPNWSIIVSRSLFLAHQDSRHLIQTT